MIIAIDGPAGVGKSTIAKWIAERFDMLYLNSGAFYRAISLFLLDNNIDSGNEKEILDTVKNVEMKMNKGLIYLNGVDITDRLWGKDIDEISPGISSIEAIRIIVNDYLKTLAVENNLVAEGRDMSTVVFPEAEIKIFLDADVHTRARRRYKQGRENLTLQEIEDSIQKRDQLDREKKFGSLSIAPDSVIIDTSNLTLQSLCARVESIISLRI